jgi:peptide/nickel transport system ATP-binding protein
MRESLLEIEDLHVAFRTKAGTVRAVNGVSLQIHQGETFAIVGESGCGKSTTGLAIMGLVGFQTRTVVSGRIALRTKSGRVVDMVRLPERRRRAVRGNDVAMIFQEPMSSLNPVYTIGAQIREAIRHRGGDRRDALRLVEAMGIPNPEQCLTSYPHQLSGGMRQRVMIAVALAGRPSLLVADEPTTALDVTIQAQILELLARLQDETGMAVIFITHNLGVVAEIAQRMAVMYAGKVVELGPVAAVFAAPVMPYTRALLASLPRLDRLGESARLEAIPGNVPNAAALPAGCAFHPRCDWAASGLCDREEPPLERIEADRLVRCLRWPDVTARPAA